jgi:hypothetical protein
MQPKFKIVTNQRDWVEKAKDKDTAYNQATKKLVKNEMILFCFAVDWKTEK